MNEPADTTKPNSISYRCKSCESTEICFDALSTWNDELQTFELHGTYPDSAPPVCNACGSEDFEEVSVEASLVSTPAGTTYLVSHRHRFGTDTLVFCGPTGLDRLDDTRLGKLLHMLDIDYEPDREEEIELVASEAVRTLTIEELEGIVT